MSQIMPLPKKLKKAITKFAKRDKKLGKKFHPYLESPGDLPLYLLAQNGRNGVKWTILAVIKYWNAEFKEFRDQTLFSVSTVEENFGKNKNETFFEILNRSSHVAKGNGELYSIRNGDTVQAFQFDFSYKFYGSLEAQRNFQISEAKFEADL